MFGKLILATAITAAFAATPAFAEGTGSQDEEYPGTTGQNRSAPGEDAGQADRRSPTGNTGDQANTTASNLDQRFNQLDLNQDGELDEDELSRYGSTAAGGSAGSTESEGNKDQGERLLKLYDHDDNDVVTQQELEKGPKSKKAQEEDEGWW